MTKWNIKADRFDISYYQESISSVIFRCFDACYTIRMNSSTTRICDAVPNITVYVICIKRPQ